MEARVVRVVEPSPESRSCILRAFLKCAAVANGQFSSLRKNSFTTNKKQVADQLRRIGRIELPEITPILGSKKNHFLSEQTGNLVFSNKRWLTSAEMGLEGDDINMNAFGISCSGHVR